MSSTMCILLATVRLFAHQSAKMSLLPKHPNRCRRLPRHKSQHPSRPRSKCHMTMFMRETSQHNVSYTPLQDLRTDLLTKTVSTQIHGYIEEAVGGVDDRVHKIFKDIALRTSLWIVSLQSLHLHIANKLTGLYSSKRHRLMLPFFSLSTHRSPPTSATRVPSTSLWKTL